MSQERVGSLWSRGFGLGALILAAAATAQVRAPLMAQGSPAAEAIVPYPGATAFCSEVALGAPVGDQPGGEIAWTAYYTPDLPDRVVAWYRSRLGSANHRREGREDLWRVPFDKPVHVVSVYARGDEPQVGSCSKRPPATSKTVIVLSTMTRPWPDVRRP
jgi:hypothetical protein